MSLHFLGKVLMKSNNSQKAVVKLEVMCVCISSLSAVLLLT